MKNTRNRLSIKNLILVILSLFLVLVIVPESFLVADTTYSYISPETGLLLDKAVTETGNYNSSGKEIFKLTLKAESSPENVINEKPTDIVLVLDTSGSMADTSQGYEPITASPSTSSTYYVYINGSYYSLSYSSNRGWYYRTGNTYYYVSWSSVNNNNDPGIPGSTSRNNPAAKPFYTIVTKTRLQISNEIVMRYLSSLYNMNKSVRVALLEFKGNTTYSYSRDLTGGLIPIQSGNNLNPVFASSLNTLTASEGTHSNTGLGHAYDILKTQSNNTSRDKIVIMFSDGDPGNYGFAYTGSRDSYRYAAAAMNQASQIKANFGSTVNSNFSFGGYQGNSIYGYTHKTTSGSEAIVNGYGLGAKLYSVGLYGSSLSTDMDDYMSRVSSNYNSNNTYVGGNYYTYSLSEDILGSYLYNIATSTVTSGTLGKNYSNISVRDYIDDRFQVVDQNGNALNAGQTLIVDGKTGTIKQDAKGIYIEWTISSLTPGYISDGGGYTASAYIVAKDDFIGGNTIPTNIANISGVYNSSAINLGSFPNPTVNVPFEFNISNKLEYIILGQYLPYEMNEVGSSMYSSTYNTPNNLITYSFNENFNKSTLITSQKSYTATITANPQDYLNFSDTSVWTLQGDGTYKKNTGEIYKIPVGALATTLVKTGNYTIKPIIPTFSVNSRTILYGNEVGVNLKDLININIVKPSDITNENWNRLNDSLSGYWDLVEGTYTSAEETTDVTPKNRTRSNVSKYDKLLAKEKRNGKEKLHS